MDRTFNLAAIAAALTVVALVLFYGPVITAFVLAGTSVALMIAVVAFSGVDAVERWRHGHPWTLRRTKTH